MSDLSAAVLSGIIARMDSADEKLASLWRRLVSVSKRFVRTFDLDRKFRAALAYGSQHPLLTLVLFSTLACLSVPVGAFVIFAAGSIAFTVMGFMFVEGTILAVAGLILGGVLLVVCFIGVTFGGVVFVFFVFLNKLWNALDLAAGSIKRKQESRQSPCHGYSKPTAPANDIPDNSERNDNKTTQSRVDDILVSAAYCTNSRDCPRLVENGSPTKRQETLNGSPAWHGYPKNPPLKLSPEESTDSSCSFDFVEKLDC